MYFKYTLHGSHMAATHLTDELERTIVRIVVFVQQVSTVSI